MEMQTKTETVTAPSAGTPYDHPSPYLSLVNYRLLQLSICLSLAAVAFSLATLGEFSLWITPSVFVFSIAHNLTLLILSYRERTGKRRVTISGSDWKGRSTDKERIPATSTRASFICAFILALMWAASFGTTLGLLIVSIPDWNGSDGIFTDNPMYWRVVPWFECIFALLEVVVLVWLGVGGVRERKMVLGLKDGPRVWLRL